MSDPIDLIAGMDDGGAAAPPRKKREAVSASMGELRVERKKVQRARTGRKQQEPIGTKGYIRYTAYLTEETRERINTLARENGYKPSAFARWLVQVGLEAFAAGERPPVKRIEEIEIVE